VSKVGKGKYLLRILRSVSPAGSELIGWHVAHD